MTSEPATANDSMSTLKSRSMTSPAKKKPMRREVEMRVALRALTGRPCCLRSMKMGVDPSTSITAKSTMKVLAI